MFGSDVLEIAIGTIFIILIVSMLASTIREMIEAGLKTRAVQLEKGLRVLLDDPTGKTSLKEVFDHPLLSGLFEGTYEPDTQLKAAWRMFPSKGDSEPKVGDKGLQWRSSLPSYIPSRNFALALLHTVAGSGKGETELSLDTIKANAMALPEGRIREAVLVAVGEAGTSLDRARASLEAWFDSSMDRVSGWYKRQTQAMLLAIGLVLAIALNVDGIHVVRELSTNTASRQQVMAKAEAFQNLDEAQRTQLAADQLKDKGLTGVIGWGSAVDRADSDLAKRRDALQKQAVASAQLKDDNQRSRWVEAQLPSKLSLILGALSLEMVAGWILTAIAVSLGAPFWFDLLNKFMIVRATVKPYEKSSPEGSEDRKGPASAAQQLAAGPVVPGSTTEAVQGGESAEPEPVAANVRMAIDLNSLRPGSLSLTKNGEPVTIPPDGFVEIPLEPDQYHRLEATARRTNGRKVSWIERRYATLEDEAEPIDIEWGRT